MHLRYSSAPLVITTTLATLYKLEWVLPPVYKKGEEGGEYG